MEQILNFGRRSKAIITLDIHQQVHPFSFEQDMSVECSKSK